MSSTINYSIVGCAASSSTSSSSSKSGTNTAPTVSSPALAGLNSGHPSLSFKVSVGKKAAKFTQVSVKLTPGISFIKHKVGKKNKITGVSLTGAKIKSLAISHGRLVIKLRKAETSFRVKLTSVLHEDGALIAAAGKGKKVTLHLSLIARNTRNKNHTISKKLSI